MVIKKQSKTILIKLKSKFKFNYFKNIAIKKLLKKENTGKTTL